MSCLYEANVRVGVEVLMKTHDFQQDNWSIYKTLRKKWYFHQTVEKSFPKMTDEEIFFENWWRKNYLPTSTGSRG